MVCPRCGNEWDASKSPCTRCGLVIRVPGQSGPMNLGHASSPPPQKSNWQQSGSFAALRPPSSSGQSGSLGGPPPGNPQSNPLTSSRGSMMVPNTPQPSISFPQVPSPRSSNSSSSSLPGVENNTALNRTSPQSQPNLAAFPMQMKTQTGTPPSAPRTDVLSPRSVPHRPQTTSQSGRSTDSLAPQQYRPQNTPRPNRLITNSLNRSGQSTQSTQGQMPSPFQQNNASPSQGSTGTKSFTADTRQLMPGTILRGGRYRLQEMQGRQEWLEGVKENWWIAQDAQRGALQVMMCELVLPESGSMVMQSTLRAATMALTSVGRHPHIPTLWDAFSDRGSNFFVFEPIEGESLLARMRRTGRAMAEQDVIECCLQMTEVLELLAQQSPPLVHGLISPEHIIVTRNGSQYVLTNFSIVLAGGATQFVAGIERTRLSVYTAPEFARGVIDVRSDLFALMATAYHAVTGSAPAGVSGSIPQAQRLNPNISPQFDAILAKGLRPVGGQRYQRPSELRQDLLAMRSVSGTLVSGGGQSGQRFEPLMPPMTTQPVSQRRERFEQPQAAVRDSVAQAFQSLAPSEDIEERKSLLPRPEELPPLEEKNDTLQAAFWLAGILICLLIIVILSRGLF